MLLIVIVIVTIIIIVIRKPTSTSHTEEFGIISVTAVFRDTEKQVVLDSGDNYSEFP